MGYSVFANTMADMAWTDVDAAIRTGAVILLPSGPMEEQGPHLPLATDLYMSYAVCTRLRDALATRGIPALIAPPYYWGINHVTGGFPGSFTVRAETMKAILFDIMACLERWGAKHLFLADFHGDPHHRGALLESLRAARQQLNLDARILISHWEAAEQDLGEARDPVLVFPVDLPADTPSGPPDDVHAGAFATATMHRHFPALVNLDLAGALPPTDLTFSEIPAWQQGGEATRRLTPAGYFGSPARFAEAAAVPDFIIEYARFAATRIAAYLQGPATA
ncbi:MAG TPA: creatininase family protein [Symbiobacteriaceae bacterium]|nr:creatininase family protein [Symbiobacteriaceae bacterium]